MDAKGKTSALESLAAVRNRAAGLKIVVAK
jgi:hypothetical protein